MIKQTGVYIQEYSQLGVGCLNEKFHLQSYGYWYTVESGGQAHTAFSTAEALTSWLTERGLHLTETLPEERGTAKYLPVEGRYRTALYLDVAAFQAIVPLCKVAQLSNGQYTLGKVTQEAGVHTVHFLNPNVKGRIVFPYEVISLRQAGFRQLIHESPDRERHTQ